MAIAKFSQKELIIAMRRRGFSYREIMTRVPVAKSTISLWLRSVGLSKRQKQRLTEKRLVSARRGGIKRHTMRLELVKRIYGETQKDVDHFDQKHLWLAGLMLYWAEGSKEKESCPGSGAQFSNSDPRMIKFFLKWLRETQAIQIEDLCLELYIHKTTDAATALKLWSEIISCDISKIKVYFKKHSIQKTNRKNTGIAYHGLIRIKVRQSSTLNRKINSWIEHICKYWGVV